MGSLLAASDDGHGRAASLLNVAILRPLGMARHAISSDDDVVEGQSPVRMSLDGGFFGGESVHGGWSALARWSQSKHSPRIVGVSSHGGSFSFHTCQPRILQPSEDLAPALSLLFPSPDPPMKRV